ncbi:MAG: hypothetical protein WA063_02415 [Minisyncoccia bacterium]
MTKEITICSKCGKEVEIKQIDGNNEEVSCESEECRIKITTLKGPMKRFVCLGNECRGNTIIIPMENKKPEQCPKCQSVELFEKNI